jgi:Pyridoxamine 5'-phosphate oxidase
LPGKVLITEEQARFLRGPNSLVLASHQGCNPECTRAYALHCPDTRDRVIVWIPAGIAGALTTNLAVEPRIAIAASRPSTHETLQLKGRVVRIDRAADQLRPLFDAGWEQFMAEAKDVGTPRRLLDTVIRWPLVEIEVEVSEIFDQTPGPGAGTRVASV